MGGPTVEEMTECKCGQKFEVVWGSCCIVNCPECGSPCKVGVCGE